MLIWECCVKLELTKHITCMLMENLSSSGASHIHILTSSAMILLVVWSANGDGIVLLLHPRQVFTK